MQKIIGIDVDDTCFDLMTAWLTRYNFDYKDNLQESDIKNWAIHEHVKTECGERIYEYLTPNLYDNILPIPHAKEAINILRRLDYKIVFVTSFIPSLAGRKYKLLLDNQFITREEEYIEARDKSLMCFDYLIDDNITNIEATRGQGIVFHREWNKNLQGYYRVNNWEQILYYFMEERLWR